VPDRCQTGARQVPDRVLDEGPDGVPNGGQMGGPTGWRTKGLFTS
jgi:hypothetical protein